MKGLVTWFSAVSLCCLIHVVNLCLSPCLLLIVASRSTGNYNTSAPERGNGSECTLFKAAGG